MRWILIAVLAALVTIDVQATEAMPGTEVVALRDAPSLIDASELAPGVTVSAIPMPAPVLEVMQPGNPLNRLHAAKKSRLARKKPAPTIMLTRTERRQLALAVGDAKVAGLRNHAYHQNDDSKTGLDELDFHRSYSRPKVVANPADVEADVPALSPEIRLRLLMARLKAVEAHALNQVPESNEALPGTVLSRLAEARRLAVTAHQAKYS
jgi:hypothetical protein